MFDRDVVLVLVADNYRINLFKLQIEISEWVENARKLLRLSVISAGELSCKGIAFDKDVNWWRACNCE